MTTIQFDVLWYLVNHPGQVVSRDDLNQLLYNAPYNGIDRSIDVYVSRIRHKIDQNELNAITEKMAEQSGIEIDVAGVMEEFDSDQDGLLSQEESQCAMESLHGQVGPPPPPPPMGGMERPGAMGAMSNQAVSEAYSQNDDDASTIDQLIESLSETDDEAEKSGIVQEWLQTLKGNNQSYSPVDIRI